MFAIAVWNRRSEELVLARDKIGKKSRSFTSLIQSASFSVRNSRFSKCIPDFRPVISKSALQQYVEYGYVHSPTPSSNECAGCRPVIRRFWTRTNFQIQSFASLPSDPPSLRT